MYAFILLNGRGVISSTFEIAQILVQSHFELVSSVPALEATEPVSSHFSTAKYMNVKATFFFM